MVNAIVEHKWKESDQENVFNAIGKIVEMARMNKLPEGFKLKSINIIGNQRRALCSWDAPSMDALKGLVSQINPPTSHEVLEAMSVF